MSIHPAPTTSTLDYRATQPPSADPPSRASARPANDVRVNPASSEVISSLLASLSSFPTTQSDSPLVPQSPQRSPSLAQSARHSISQRPPSSRSHQPRDPRDPRDPSIDFAEFRHPPVPQDFPEPSATDAAEPPTIRTARPPSGLSRLTAPRSSRRAKVPPSPQSANYEALSIFPSPPDSARSSNVRLDGPLPPLPRISADRLKSRAGFGSAKKSPAADDTPKAKGLGLQRDSLVLLRSREKGKEKERAGEYNTVAQAQAQASTTSLPPPISRFRTWSTRGAQTSAASRVASPTRSDVVPDDDDDDDLDGAPGPSIPLRPKNSSDVRARPRDRRPSFQENRTSVPSRSSSLRNRSISPPRSRILSRRSSRQSVFKSPETVPEETLAQEAFVQSEILGARENMPGSSLTPLPPLSPMSLDEDNEVVRRIRELRAAKEERQRAHVPPPLQPAPRSPVMPRQPPPNGMSSPPLTTRAVKQLDQADVLEERHIRVQEDYPMRGASLSPTSAAFAFQSLPPDLTGSRVDFGASPRTLPGSPRAPPSPVLSRASSTRRWPNPDSTSRKNSLHRRESSRGQTSAIPCPPVPEERRASFDSVKDSVKEFLGSSRLSQRIQSPVDNRMISFSEVGDPHGFVVFCCVGMGLTRYVTAFYEELASSLKLRLITPERPGIGGSSPYAERRTPLFWPDDVRAICSHLGIRDFSLIAHSAGTIYALATALQMPSRVKGKIHLLAPWIPPSQMTSTSRSSDSNVRAGGIPRSQKFLRLVPTSFLKLTNSSYFTGGRPSPKGRKGDSALNSPRPSTSSRAWNASTPQVPLSAAASGRPSTDRYAASYRMPLTPNLEEDVPLPSDHSFTAEVLSAANRSRRPSTATGRRPPTAPEAKTRQKRYDEELTQRVWDLSTKGANPAVDLIVCLERNQPIGFRYADISRQVVIRHGTRDARIPVDNVKWLVTTMQKAELRVLEGEGHSLMSNAGLMAQVLSEVGKEWEQRADAGLADSSAFNSPAVGERREPTMDDPAMFE